LAAIESTKNKPETAAKTKANNQQNKEPGSLKKYLTENEYPCIFDAFTEGGNAGLKADFS